MTSGKPPGAFRNSDLAHMLIVFVVLLAIYMLTMPLEIGLADSGIFIMSSYFYGVAHPPGYPLHTILGFLATLVPIGSIAFRVHMVSAVFGAVTCSLVWLFCRRQAFGTLAASTAALAFGVSGAFWSQAIIAEVYTLNTFFFFLLLNLAVAFRSSGSAKTGRWMALVYGLSLANHWPLMVLASSSFLFIVWPRRAALVKDCLRLVGLFTVGLTPYVAMYFRSHADPAFSFNGRLRNLSDLWFVVSRKGYAHAGNIMSADPFDRVQFAAFITNEMTLQLTVIGFALAAIGAWYLKRTMESALFWALVWAWFSNCYMLLILLNMDFGYRNQTNFSVIPLVTYGVVAIALGAGVAWTLRSSQQSRAGRLVGTMLCAVLVISIFMVHLPTNDRRAYGFATDVARTILETVDENAVIITTQDSDTLPLAYLHFVEGIRPDVSIIHAKGLLFNSRIFPAQTTADLQHQYWEEFLSSCSRPVYATGGFLKMLPNWDLGLYQKLKRENGVEHPIIPRSALDLFARIVLLESSDPSTIQTRGPMVYAFAMALNRIVLTTSNPAERERVQPYIDIVDPFFHGKLARATAGFDIEPPENLLALLDEQEMLDDSTLDNWTRARFYYLRARLQVRVGHDGQASADWWQSAFYDRNPASNQAMARLLQHHRRLQNRAEYDRARAAFFPGPVPAHLEYIKSQPPKQGGQPETDLNLAPERFAD